MCQKQSTLLSESSKKSINKNLYCSPVAAKVTPSPKINKLIYKFTKDGGNTQFCIGKIQKPYLESTKSIVAYKLST